MQRPEKSSYNKKYILAMLGLCHIGIVPQPKSYISETLSESATGGS